MQHQIHSLTGALTDSQVPDVALDEFELAPLRWRDEPPYLLKIFVLTRRKIVQSADLLIELEQGFDEVRPDKPGGAGDEPGSRRPFQFGSQFFIGSHVTSRGSGLAKYHSRGGVRLHR